MNRPLVPLAVGASAAAACLGIWYLVTKRKHQLAEEQDSCGPPRVSQPASTQAPVRQEEAGLPRTQETKPEPPQPQPEQSLKLDRSPENDARTRKIEEKEGGTKDGKVWEVEDEDEDMYTSAGGREVCEIEIQKILERDDKPVSDFWRNKYEKEARRMWDVFYKVNKTKFFKDRHYLDKEWTELRQGAKNVVEVGCGVGNTALPLLAINPQLKVWACDFSDNAVEYLQQSEGFDKDRCVAFTSDLTKDALSAVCGPASMDCCLMIFVLSAINPECFLHVLQNVAAALKPGGKCLFRDYGLYDMAQLKMAEPKGHKISDNFYVRKDGTRAYYFAEEEVRGLFEQAGFEVEQLEMHKRLVRNRKEGYNMHRRWVQGTFLKSPQTVSL